MYTASIPTQAKGTTAGSNGVLAVPAVNFCKQIVQIFPETAAGLHNKRLVK
jgi:hypothetical protein